MKKLPILLLLVAFLVQPNISKSWLYGQTKKTAQQDTTKKTTKKTGLELPDVIIYGKN